jgi:hypothetical protein
MELLRKRDNPENKVLFSMNDYLTKIVLTSHMYLVLGANSHIQQ